MHSSTALLVCLGLLLLASPSVALDDDWCGYDPQVDRSTYDYGDSVRAKFIFVDFRDGPYWNFSIMEEELQQAVVDTVKWWLSSMTQHQFEFTADSGIVFHPDDDFTGDGTAAPWRADLRPVQYAVPDSLTTQERNWYLCRWQGGGQCDPDSLVADISGWWTTSNISYSHLMAEILYKIYAAWENESPSTWPFGDHNAYRGEDDAVDALFFVFMANKSVYGNYGGTPGIAVVPAAVFDFDEDNGERFFGNVKHGASYFQGTGQEHNSVDYDDGHEFKIGNSAFVILHEFSHTFQWGDGPPLLQGTDADDIWRYYYGGLNITSQHYVPGPGLPVVSLHNLANMTEPWVPVIDFTGQNLRDVKLYDLRHREDADSLGTIYKFRMEGQDARPQWFLFAYHAGYGVDAQSDPEAGELIPSRGLEIQHVVGAPYGIVDIESAFGLFHNITVDSLPPIEIPPEFDDWSDANAVRGFDNYDLWWVGNDSTALRALQECGDPPNQWHCWPLDYGRMQSQPFDFFTADTLWSSGNEPWTKPEFSYRTNPSCFWYADDWHTQYSYRFNQQRLPNSLFVRIKEQHDEESQNDAPYMKVDFFSAPEEIVLAPDCTSGNVVFSPGDTVLVTWTNDFEDAITSIDVLLSKAGDSWVAPDTLASGFAVGAHDTTWAWVVGPEEGTDHGK